VRRTCAAGSPRPPLVVRDLGCGTGSLGRWLAPAARAAALGHAGPRSRAAGPCRRRWPHARTARGHRATPLGDVTALTAADLAGTSLVTCSALLDLLTAEEVDAIAAALAATGTPALLTLSVVGAVTFDPPDDLDGEISAAFNDHQRRTTGERRLLGPDAPEVAAEIFAKHGARVTARPSPWRLGPDRSALAAEWLRGWTAAAAEQRPDLPVDGYRRGRLDAARSGGLDDHRRSRGSSRRVRLNRPPPARRIGPRGLPRGDTR
jgi:hypothetical protein